MAVDCYECTAYGDDYYLNDDGEWVSACKGCPNNERVMKSPCDTCSLFPCVDDSNMRKVEKYCPWHNPKPKPITNADRVRNMTDDELVEWYWWMLHYMQNYTDSRIALHEWLKKEYKE